MNPNINFAIDIMEEDSPVRGHFCLDPETNTEMEDEIIDRLNRGDDWAWCTVKVTATWGDDKRIVGEDYLGCCSYENEKDFKEERYYEDMCENALEQLKSKMKVDVNMLEEYKRRLANF